MIEWRRRIEERKFLGVRTFDPVVPERNQPRLDSRTVIGKRPLAFYDSCRQHVNWCVQEAQLDSVPVIVRPRASAIAVLTHPDTGLVRDGETAAEEHLSEFPLEHLDDENRTQRKQAQAMPRRPQRTRSPGREARTGVAPRPVPDEIVRPSCASAEILTNTNDGRTAAGTLDSLNLAR